MSRLHYKSKWSQVLKTGIFYYRNVRIACEQHPIPSFLPWLEMDNMVDVSEEMLMDAVAKAEQEVLQRRKMEYEVWSKGNNT